jgi:hypothetical protein
MMILFKSTVGQGTKVICQSNLEGKFTLYTIKVTGGREEEYRRERREWRDW